MCIRDSCQSLDVRELFLQLLGRLRAQPLVLVFARTRGGSVQGVRGGEQLAVLPARVQEALVFQQLAEGLEHLLLAGLGLPLFLRVHLSEDVGQFSIVRGVSLRKSRSKSDGPSAYRRLVRETLTPVFDLEVPGSQQRTRILVHPAPVLELVSQVDVRLVLRVFGVRGQSFRARLGRS